MNEDNNNLDLLDLDDANDVDALPDATPFATPRPKKPWLLMAVGVIVIILATYIIVRTVGGNSSSSIEVDLDAPAVIVDDGSLNVPARPENAPAMPVAAQPTPVPAPAPAAAPVNPAPAPQPVAAPVQETVGTPVRVVEDRKTVTFNPDKPVAAKPVAKPKTATKPAAKAAPKKVVKQQVAPAHGGWYVQFGSYSTRALAEAAQRKIQAGHQSLFAGKQFVILAAQLPNGKTTYRLRVAFATSADANGFCRNAKSDGLDCYVAK